MNVTKLINFMENLRYERKLNQEEYLGGVVSQRQYYRYRYGQSEAPLEIILRLCEKLEMPYPKLIYQFIEETERSKKLVQEYFNLVISKKSKEAEALFAQISENEMIDDDSRILVKLGKVLCEFNQGHLSKIEMVGLIKEHMHYDDLLKRGAFHDVEVYMLGLVMEYSDYDRAQLLEKLLVMLESGKIMTGGTVTFNLQVYFWIIKNLGRMNRFLEVIKFSNLAIDYAHKGFSCYSIEFFHYYKALAHFRLGETALFGDELYNAIIVCMYQKEENRQRFFATIQKDTGINPIDFMISRCDRARLG